MICPGIGNRRVPKNALAVKNWRPPKAYSKS